MTKFHSSFLSLAAVLGVLLFSGCSTTSEYFSNVFHDQVEVSDEIATAETDPEMLAPPETDSGLDQELEALRQTGDWKLPSPADAEEEAAGVSFDFPVVHNKQVDMYISLFQGKQRKIFTRWLTRSGKYAPIMQSILSEENLPLDLVYLSMIESGFNQKAYSSARAVGLWQFMNGTGKQYGLRIDSQIDERRDIEKSTRAAAAYLDDLYNDFGDWPLAVAAYNAGPGTIHKGLTKYNVDNFWDLAQHNFLRLETKRYVPKLIAAILIAKEPEKYGFTDIDYAEPVQYDTLEVGPGLNFNAIALLADTNSDIIKDLNLELKNDKTPLNSKQHLVKIPAGTHDLALKNKDRLHSMVSTGYKIHIYRKKETLTQICLKYDINKTTLLRVNDITAGRLRDGQKLKIPYTTVTYQLLPEGNQQAIAAYRDNLILHRIKKGETISKIAKKYNVPPELIVSWNGLESVHKIRAGQQLALYISSAGTVEPQISSTPIVEDNIIVLNDAKKKAVGAPDNQISWYQVQSGDSLWTISKKFNISPAKIKEWNNLKSNLIHPGIRLKIINV